MNYSVVVLGGVLLLSIAWYYFPVYGGVHWFTGPISNIDIPVADKADPASRRSSESFKKDGDVVVTEKGT